MNNTRTLLSHIAAQSDGTVTVAGWVHKIRSMGAITFLLLRDRSGMAQIVYKNKHIDVSLESVLRVSGIVRKNDKAEGGYEISEVHTEILSSSAENLVLTSSKSPREYALDTLLDHRLFSLRNPSIRSIFELESKILASFSASLREKGFTEIKTSKLIGRGTEGGTEMFRVDYFGEPVFLTQSPQFYKQAMVASGLERVYESAPAYRAEKHETSRHLSEYISLDVEMGFIENEHDLMDLEQALLGDIFRDLDGHPALELWDASLPSLQAWAEVPRIPYAEAKAILKKRMGKSVFDIQPAGERELCKWAEDEYGIDAVFVYAFPRKKRPFYSYFEDTITRSFDLLFRGVEITTGGQRIHEFTAMKESIAYFRLDEHALRDYLSIFSSGCPPHGGFAIGLERFTQKILGLENVKEAAAFPRDRRRITP